MPKQVYSNSTTLQIAASEPPESAFKPASKLAGSDGDLKGLAKEGGRKGAERSGSVWGVFGRVSSLLSTASSSKKKVRPQVLLPEAAASASMRTSGGVNCFAEEC